MFSKLFKKSEPKKPKTPEIMGLYLGGSFELDHLKLSLLEPELTIEGAARSQLIQAVGEAPLDTGGTLLRFYTDDDGFLQVVTDGGLSENHITDVKLWHFYETQTIGNTAQWNACLKNVISQPTYELDGKVLVNPSLDATLNPGDTLFYIAERRINAINWSSLDAD